MVYVMFVLVFMRDYRGGAVGFKQEFQSKMSCEAGLKSMTKRFEPNRWVIEVNGYCQEVRK